MKNNSSSLFQKSLIATSVSAMLVALASCGGGPVILVQLLRYKCQVP